MKCPICEKGTLHARAVDTSRHGIFVGHYRAQVCNACGEQIFDSQEAEKIESKIKELGLWGAEPTRVYKIGGNVAIAIRKKVAELVGLTKDSKLTIIPQAREKRLIVELTR